MIEMTRRNPRTLKTAAPFDALFSIDYQTLEAVCKSMNLNGFDPAFPIIIWQERDVVIDGHTRLYAAMACDFPSVPVIEKNFASEDGAVEYAIHCQRDRRNVTDADLLRCVAELDERRKRGGDRASEAKASCGANGKSATETAQVIGTSTRKVEKARTVLDHAKPSIKAAVLAGEKTINQAYQETQKARAKGRLCGCGNPVEGVGFFCPVCRAEPLRNNKPQTVQPNLPLTDRDDPEPRASRSNGPIRTVPVRESIISGFDRKAVRDRLKAIVALDADSMREALETLIDELR